MPKLRVIIKPPPEPQGDAEQQTEALRDYLLQMSEELAYVLTHLEADNINDSTFERIQSMIPRPYTGLPVMDGDASSGQSEQWARGDHRHGHDSSKADVTALATETAAREAHEADTGNPHEVTKAQVGLSNVANERQYSAQNPPPIPTPGDVGAIPVTEKGSVGGVAELDSSGMVPSAQLPSYVDDVLSYPTLADFPAIGEDGKIYVAKDTNRQYRWSGSDYVEISKSLALGETSSTAYRGDRGKTAYDHSQVVSGNPHHVTAAEVGARPDTWTPSAADVGAQPTITASGMLKGDGLGGVSAATAGTDYQAPLTAGTDYQTPLVAGTDYATPAMIPTVPDPSDAAPQDLGTADAGVSDDYSRADHVHNMPDADDIDYDNTGSGLSATDVQAALDELAAGGGGGGPSPATAVPVMDGTGAVGVSLLYAREDHEHPSDTAKQDSITASGILKGDGNGGVSAAAAGTDYQAPLAAGTDYATPGMIPTVPSAYTSNPAMDGTASPGSSGAWARGDHVHPSDTSRVPVYGMGKNLLDNAYFVGGGSQLGDGIFPINQRGQSTYTGTVYGPDRWKGANNQSVMTLVSGGLQLSTTDNTFRIWQQLCDNATKDRLSGKTGTISVIEDGVLYTATGTFGTRFDTVGAKYTYSVNTSNNEICRIGGGTNGTAVVTAIKVELGSQQTLCHNEGTDANPVWVPNEIPDYEEELIKCQTSTADSTDTYANKSLATEQQLAYVETGTTASRAYAIGEYFCWNGLLYRVKTAISSGVSFTPGTNCESVTGGIASQLLAAGNARYTQYYKTDSNGTVTHNVSASCMFLIMTYNVNSAERTNGVYFGWVDTVNANYSHVNTIFTPTAYPPTVTVGLGTISIEVLRYTRITILEFVRTN